MPRYAAGTRQSAELWPDFAAELENAAGVDIAYRRPGGFHLALSEAELDRRRDMLERLDGQPGMQPCPYEMLDGDEVRRRLPEAGPLVAGGSYCPLDGPVHSLRLLRRLPAGFAAPGGSSLEDPAVDRKRGKAAGWGRGGAAGGF